jgi:hypothetical protein
MPAPLTTNQLIHEINDPKYQSSVQRALSRAHEEAFVNPRSFRIGKDRMIIFSDLHKGARNGADDFRHCERAYNAALGYYYALGYWLVELGDVEELWEEHPASVLKNYERTLRLSAKFHIDPERRGSRYLRVWGNHDDQWGHKRDVEKYLKPIYCPEGTSGLEVHQAVKVMVEDADGERVGELFLAHGHQGTTDSDRFAWLARFVVRYIWRPIQRLTKIRSNTAAKDWVLREKHNLAMYKWAFDQNRGDFVFVAGHTHKPVFLGRTRSDTLAESVQRAEEELRRTPADTQLASILAQLTAELEWTRAESGADTGKDGIAAQHERVCYFNSGCSAFQDGDITGIEIVGDEIRLVRWPDDTNAPKPQILAGMTFSTLFSVAPAGS